jgi:SAM-dependent methyltransferase
MTDVWPVAHKGFGSSAQTYARGRPEYPSELLTWLRQDLKLAPNRTAIDLGAGTGKFTKLLVQTGANIIAIEPVDAMRTELAACVPGARTLAGSARAMNLQDGAADAVLCAQAFHWFANELAVVEIHRVLKPGGLLGLVWNVRDESVDWVAAITDIIAPFQGDTPRYNKGDWRRAFTGDRFSALRETCVQYMHTGSPEKVIVDRFLSVSFIAALPADEKSKVTEKLRNLIAHHPKIRGCETISVPYQTHAYCCVRK